jgi:hypothetical protein
MRLSLCMQANAADGSLPTEGGVRDPHWLALDPQCEMLYITDGNKIREVKLSTSDNHTGWCSSSFFVFLSLFFFAFFFRSGSSHIGVILSVDAFSRP